MTPKAEVMLDENTRARARQILTSICRPSLLTSYISLWLLTRLSLSSANVSGFLANNGFSKGLKRLVINVVLHSVLHADDTYWSLSRSTLNHWLAIPRQIITWWTRKVRFLCNTQFELTGFCPWRCGHTRATIVCDFFTWHPSRDVRTRRTLQWSYMRTLVLAISLVPHLFFNCNLHHYIHFKS